MRDKSQSTPVCCEISFAVIYMLFGVKELLHKTFPCKEIDKYEVENL